MNPPTNDVLLVKEISKSFGGLKAVQDFSLALGPGSLQGLIGPNGAGKTTAFNLLTGVYQPNSHAEASADLPGAKINFRGRIGGEISLAGRDIRGKKPSEIAALGMARTFQNIRLFGNLSVLDNVKIACHLRVKHSMMGAVVRTMLHRREEAEIEARSHELLKIFDLDDRVNEEARNLAYGDQRRLEIARAIATDPKVLLLDEPAAGMNPQEKIALKGLIRKVRDQFKLTVLLIEHDMGVVMDLCEKITVLDHGQTIAVGSPQEVQNNPKVIEAYLGVEAVE